VAAQRRQRQSDVNQPVLSSRLLGLSEENYHKKEEEDNHEVSAIISQSLHD